MFRHMGAISAVIFKEQNFPNPYVGFQPKPANFDFREMKKV